MYAFLFNITLGYCPILLPLKQYAHHNSCFPSASSALFMLPKDVLWEPSWILLFFTYIHKVDLAYLSRICQILFLMDLGQAALLEDAIEQTT